MYSCMCGKQKSDDEYIVKVFLAVLKKAEV